MVFAALKNQDLMPQGKDFRLHGEPSLKTLPKSEKERKNDRERGIGKLYRLPLKFNGLNRNGVFGRDSGKMPQALEHYKMHACGLGDFGLRARGRYLSAVRIDGKRHNLVGVQIADE